MIKNLIIAAAVLTGCSALVILVMGLVFPSRGAVSKSADDMYVSVLGSSLRYVSSGSGGENIILLHGFAGSLESWKPVMKHLTCCRSIALDLIGFGDSSCPDITFDLETQRRYLLGFMDAMNIDRAVLVGSSMGASLAAWTAAHSPNRIQAIVLSAPSAYPGSLTYPWPFSLVYRPGNLNKMALKCVRTNLFQYLFPKSFARQALDITASYDDSFASALKKIGQPTLLIWSRGDRKVPFNYNLRYRELIQRTTFIEAPEEAGHGAAFFDPHTTGTQICDFLRDQL